MFHRIALFKLTDVHANDATRASVANVLRTALDKRGYDASVGVPADEGAKKSWDISIVTHDRTIELAQAFDPASFFADQAGVPGDAVAVVKTWIFEG